MMFEEGRIWLGKFFRHPDDAAFVLSKVLFQCWVRKVILESSAKHYAPLFVHRYQAVVKSGIVQARQTKTIAWIQAFAGKIPPRLDMAGNQQSGDRNIGDAAANAIRGKNRLTEKLLTAPRSNCGLNLCWSHRRHQSHLISLEKINFPIVVSGEKIVEQLFAFGAERRKIRLELFPDFPVVLRRAWKSLYTARPLDGVERSEVAEFHGQTVRRAPQLGRDVYDDRVVPMKFSKREFAINVQRDERMLTRPFYAGSLKHA